MARPRRYRDLADIAMLAQQVDRIDAERLVNEMESEAARRPDTLARGLPRELQLSGEQLSSWATGWGSGGRIVPISVDDAYEAARALLDPVIGRRVTSGAWRSETMSWG